MKKNEKEEGGREKKGYESRDEIAVLATLESLRLTWQVRSREKKKRLTEKNGKTNY